MMGGYYPGHAPTGFAPTASWVSHQAPIMTGPAVGGLHGLAPPLHMPVAHATSQGGLGAEACDAPLAVGKPSIFEELCACPPVRKLEQLFSGLQHGRHGGGWGGCETPYPGTFFLYAGWVHFDRSGGDIRNPIGLTSDGPLGPMIQLSDEAVLEGSKSGVQVAATWMRDAEVSLEFN